MEAELSFRYLTFGFVKMRALTVIRSFSADMSKCPCLYQRASIDGLLLENLPTYQNLIGGRDKADSMESFVLDGIRVLPRITDGKFYHRLRLVRFKCGLRGLSRQNIANFSRKIHRVLAIS